MKKVHFTTILCSLFLVMQNASAAVNFSGLFGGSVGIQGKSGENAEFGLPFNVFAVAQANFDSWGIIRADLELKSKDLLSGNLFTGQDATLKLNELSFVTTKNTGSITNYLGVYLGTYEVVGKDDYLQRQFGMSPVTSLLTKSATTLSCGLPLYKNYGVGLSYTMHFNTVPGTAGVNLYFNMTDNSTLQMNLDLRTAWATKFITVDLAAGIGAPLQNKYMGNDVILLIDTLYLHGGVSVLFGSNYTHSLFLQAGVQNIPISRGSFPKTFSGYNDIFLLLEPRIYTKALKARITAYNIPENTLPDMMYLEDPLGAALSIYTDAIDFNSSKLTVGVHLIAGLENQNIFSLMDTDFTADIPALNIYCTPFVDFPVANGNLEVMAQIGACDILDSFCIQYKVKVGYKKAF